MRRRTGWTQEQLADRIGIEAATLSRYETARIPLPLAILGRAAAAFGVPAKAFLGTARVHLPKATAAERALLTDWSRLDSGNKDLLRRICRQMRRTQRAPSAR
jgi:transcriptional regulator with XRE-family HTH domain